MADPAPLYDAASENVGFDAELARLEAQVALSWHAELRRLRGLGITDRPRIVELGCGPGQVTRRLHAAFPGCTIAAVDCDERLLAHARSNLAGLAGIDLIAADAAATGLPAASYDLIVSRYLFQHLADAAPVAREALRLLRPGGVHAIIDIDDGLWGTVTPAYPRLAEIHARSAALQEATGRDRHVGRHLWRILTDSGHASVDVDLFCYSSDALGLDVFAPQLDPARLLPLVAKGQIPMSDLIAAQVMTDAFMKAPNAQVLLVGFIGSGRRPE